jgi:translation initiation factor IF-2
MKVSDIAKELNTTSDDILKVLKSLKLKAKDSDQELSSVVASIVRSEYSKAKKQIATEKPAPVKEVPKAVEQKEKEPEEKIVKAKAPKEVKEKKTEVTKKKATEEKKEAPAKKTADKKSKETKLIIKKTTKVVKKPVVEEAPKAKSRISREPLITLKPLARKKKKMGGGESGHERFGGVHSEQETISEQEAPTTEAGQDSGTVQPASSTQATTNLQPLEIRLPITVKDFSVKIQQKPSVVLMRLMKYGLMAHINMSLDGEIVTKLAQDFGFALTKIKTQEEQLVDVHKTAEEDPKLLSPRAPIVTIMGHVDHGKTTLLDRLRKSRVADNEHGGITQHMGAYSINVPKGRITFLDTPGHEAFTSMRARGAHITDLVVLVVAADEGIMPQTEEAIDHARAAQAPIVVAINKIDSRNANLDRVKKQLSDIDLMPEDWGGKTVTAGVSALTGEGVDNLLDLILLESELLELKANPNKNASGIIVEAHLSKGKGVLVTLIVQSGTLNEGDIVVVGPQYGKIKAMFDDNGRAIKSAGPSMPVEILGMPAVPEPGEQFYVLNDEKQARDITGVRQEQLKTERLGSNQKMTLEELYSKIQDGAVKELSVVLKADVQGSLEALRDSLAKIPSDKVKIRFIHTGVGDVNTSDVLLAAVSKGIIIGFHVDIDARAKQELEKQPVEVKQYRIIYDAVNDIRNALEGLLEAKSRKKPMARVEIRQVFKLSKHGIIAGCYVAKGKVIRKAHADVVRNGEIVHSGTISSLKRFKDDVREVIEGMECGISISGYDKYEVGDFIEVYELEMIAQKL